MHGTTAAEVGSSGAPKGSLPKNRPLLLVSGATATMKMLVGGGLSTTAAIEDMEHLGRLATPRIWSSIASYPASGLPWAADNDCFQRLDAAAYIRMLQRIAEVDRSQFLFVTVPDRVADAATTMELWSEWWPKVERLNLPAAFVAQDGQDPAQVPWASMAALFVGGSTAYKLGEEAAALIREAQRREKWVHIGRLNTWPRLRYFEQLTIDSFDGTQFSRFPKKYIPAWAARLRYRQAGLDVF